jgi:uncharacterized protein YdaU (DUF1376 family)
LVKAEQHEPTAPGKSPAFQFYPKDFLSDGNQAGMSLQECGAYIRLLCVCWNEGTLPNDVTRLARYVGATVPQMRKLWPAVQRCFRLDADGLYRHPRLERERDKQSEYRRRQSDAAAKRWHPAGNATAMPPHMPPHMPNASQPDALHTAVSNLQSADSGQKGKDRRHPKVAFDGSRLKVWKWQHEDLARRLGAHEFDLLGWYAIVDSELTASGEGIGEPWDWLQQRFKADAGIRSTDMFGAKNGKTAGNLAALQRFVARGQEGS